MATEWQQENNCNFKYNCKNCDYYTNKKSSFKNHNISLKHNLALKIMPIMPIMPKVEPDTSVFYCCTICNKAYNDRSGLWKHKKKCIGHNTLEKIEESYQYSDQEYYEEECEEETDEECEEYENKIISENNTSLDTANMTLLFIDAIKQNQEFQKQMFEMMKETMGTHNTMINSHNNTTNNKFNLNFFLNETCKDAMNIKEFVDSIELNFEDVEYSGKHGFTEGMIHIFLRELNKLDVCKRPIHCTDLKREVFHIKNENNEWENERSLIFKMINLITRKNMFVLKDWSEANPLCMNMQTAIHDRFVQLKIACFGPYDNEIEKKEFNKIIARVAKATLVDKKCWGRSSLVLRGQTP